MGGAPEDSRMGSAGKGGKRGEALIPERSRSFHPLSPLSLSSHLSLATSDFQPAFPHCLQRVTSFDPLSGDILFHFAKFFRRPQSQKILVVERAILFSVLILTDFTRIGIVCRKFHSFLNFHSCRHIGHNWCTCCEFSHFMMQWMWKQCEHWPQTAIRTGNRC